MPHSKHMTFREYLEVQATKTSQDLVEDIDNLTKDIFKNMENPERISHILLELAIKNVGLGNYLIEALDQLRSLETIYDHNLGKRKIELTKTVDPNSPEDKPKTYSATVAESMAELDLYEMQESLGVAKKAVEILKIKRADTEKVIDAARSRLSLIKQDIRNS